MIKKFLIFLFILFYLSISYASYLFPGGNNNNVQYNNGSGLSGSNNFFFSNPNVGIGSSVPGQTLDVQGTIRMTGLTINSNSPSTGYLLTASDSKGDITWSPTGWTSTGVDVYNTQNGNVGIGTSMLTNASLTVMNGNVGIGTWVTRGSLDIVNSNGVYVENGNMGIGTIVPSNLLELSGSGNVFIDINSNTNNQSQVEFLNGPVKKYQFSLWYSGSYIDLSRYATGSATPDFALDTGNVGIGTGYPSAELEVGLEKFDVLSNGNVGLGSAFPGQALDVQGTIRDLGEFINGNIGFGTSNVNGSGEAALTVMNGNVGIGTWVTPRNFNLVGDSYRKGNIGIGTTYIGGANEAGLTVMSGSVGIGTWTSVYSDAFDVVGNVGLNTAYNLVATGSGTVIFSIKSDPTSVYLGLQAGFNTSGGNLHDTAIGYQALYTNVSGTDNTAAGYRALYLNTASFNTAEGSQALYNNSSGQDNTAAGYQALYNNTIGNNNTALGAYALGNLTGAFSDNTAAGYYAGAYFGGSSSNALTQCTGCVFIGANTYAQANGDSNEIVLGYGAIGNGSNTVTLGGSGTSSTIIPYGNVGIGSTHPGQALDVVGTIRALGLGVTNNASAGYLLVTNAVGVGTWMSPANTTASSIISGSNNGVAFYSGGSTVSGGTGFEYNGTNVGIGTTLLSTAGLSVMSGNLGIGTWVPALPFSITGDNYLKGNVGIGTTFMGSSNEASLSIMNGDVGIGTWTPSAILELGTQDLDILGTGLIGIGTILPVGGLTIGSNEHLGVTGSSKPVLSSCGAGPSITGNDFAFTVTAGTGANTGCTVTFAGGGFSTIPTCIASSEASIAAFSYVVSKTALTVTATGLSSNNFDAICFGHD